MLICQDEMKERKVLEDGHRSPCSLPVQRIPAPSPPTLQNSNVDSKGQQQEPSSHCEMGTGGTLKLRDNSKEKGNRIGLADFFLLKFLVSSVFAAPSRQNHLIPI